MGKGRNGGLYLFIFFAFIFYSFWNQGIAAEGSGLLSAYQDTGAEIEKISIHSHVRISNKYTSLEESIKIGMELIEKLDMIPISDKQTDNKDEVEVSWEGINRKGHKNHLKIRSFKSGADEEVYIGLDTTIESRWSEIVEEEQKIKLALSPYGAIQNNCCIVGTYEGESPEKEKSYGVQRIMDALQGKEVEAFKDKELFSITGFSRRIEHWISYDGKKANFQIALRYNNLEDKTYLWLGTPLIDIAY